MEKDILSTIDIDREAERLITSADLPDIEEEFKSVQEPVVEQKAEVVKKVVEEKPRPVEFIAETPHSVESTVEKPILKEEAKEEPKVIPLPDTMKYDIDRRKEFAEFDEFVQGDNDVKLYQRLYKWAKSGVMPVDFIKMTRVSFIVLRGVARVARGIGRFFGSRRRENGYFDEGITQMIDDISRAINVMAAVIGAVEKEEFGLIQNLVAGDKWKKEQAVDAHNERLDALKEDLAHPQIASIASRLDLVDDEEERKRQIDALYSGTKEERVAARLIGERDYAQKRKEQLLTSLHHINNVDKPNTFPKPKRRRLFPSPFEMQKKAAL